MLTVVNAALRLLDRAWELIAPLAGVAVGWWLARRAARDDEQRAWAISFRRLLGRMQMATIRYSAMVDVAPGVAKARAMPISSDELRIEGWKVWSKVAEPLEDDFLLYLEVLPFFTMDQRVRAIPAWYGVAVDATQVGKDETVTALAALDAVLKELSTAIDRALRLRTPRQRSQGGGPRLPQWAHRLRRS